MLLIERDELSDPFLMLQNTVKLNKSNILMVFYVILPVYSFDWVIGYSSIVVSVYYKSDNMGLYDLA